MKVLSAVVPAMLVLVSACATAPPVAEGAWPAELPLLRWTAVPLVEQQRIAPTGPPERDAVEWVTRRLGEAGDDVELEVVAHDDYGPGKASGDRHCFVIAQTWRGHQTDRIAVVYVADREIRASHEEIGRLAVVPGSEKRALDEGEVRRVASAVLRELGAADVDAQDVPLRLEFIWQEGDGASAVLHPVWTMGPGPFFVDARTGAPGRNG